MIASGGDSNDASLKLWKKHNTFWDCVSSIYEHAERINDLQLTQNQKHLISASDDELIKIWRFKPPDYQLECIQTLNDHKHCVYYISISWDSLFMASSCWGNYFNIYKSDQTSIGLWKRWNQIDTKGKIKRIYFTKTNDLLVQQKNPSLIIVYQKNQKNLFLPVQEVKLNQSDSIHILFPIFQQDNKIYLKNDNFVYILRRLKTGNYFIQQILSGSYYSGCSDITGEGIIVWDTDNKLVEVYI